MGMEKMGMEKMGNEKDMWAELERWIREAIWRGETIEEQTRDCVEVVREWIARGGGGRG